MFLENNTLRNWIRPAINALGYDVVKFPARPHARHLKDFIRDKNINLFIDVGAHKGGFCRLLRQEVRYFGPIVSLEPSLFTFQAVQKAMFTDHNWRGLQFGLSDVDTEGTLNTFEDNTNFNSLLSLRQKDAIAFNVNLSKAGYETINLRKLDTLWEDIVRDVKDPRIFLKIDTQGHDISVVRGALKHLEFMVGIQSEVPAIEIYEGMTSMIDTLAFFRGIGYTPTGFYEVNRPKTYNGAVPEFDVIFKRDTA